MNEIIQVLRKFRADRDWSPHHTPNNLMLALMGEVGELAAELQWVDDVTLTPEIQDEWADCMIYLLNFADVMGIAPHTAIMGKIGENARKYPVDKSEGKVDLASVI